MKDFSKIYNFPYFMVTHIDDNGNEVVTAREDSIKALYVYNDLKKDGFENIKLEEISENETIVLRGTGIYTS